MIDQLKELRQLWGWPQTFVAELLRVSRSTVSRWERGVSKPNATNKEKLDALTAMLEQAKASGQPDKAPEVSVFTHSDEDVRKKKIENGGEDGADTAVTEDGTAYLLKSGALTVVADV